MGMHPLQIVANAARRLENLFPGYFNATTKRNHYIDFGYPEQIIFPQYWQMYRRNGIAKAGVEKTVLKTWQDLPTLIADDNADEITPVEQAVIDRFRELRFWQRLVEADRRSLVGHYAGLILRVADNKDMREPVDRVPGGLDGLVEVIPAWEGQLTVSEWDDDTSSENYGQPKLFQFNENGVGGDESKRRQFDIHPDRVVIWSTDGTVFGEPLLSAGFNDLITIEKIIGSGGEGFWKNAKSAPVLQVDKEANIAEMAKMFGTSPEELADKIDEQVEDFNKGFDAMLMLQGIEAKTLGVTLPQPEQFLLGPLWSFAGSIGMPFKILTGSQTGERASTEDAREWAQTIMSRRQNTVIPNIMTVVRRLVDFGVLADAEWSLDWPDLTEASMEDKIARADKMADVNQKMQRTGEIVFTPEEIRETVGLQPLSEAEKYLDDEGDDDPVGVQPPEEDGDE